MKALVLKEYNKFVFEEVPDPAIKENEVLIKVKACGICGSDVHGMDGSTGRRIPPIIMGHEASGEIVEVGKEVSGWMEGDRVTFDSTIYPLDDWFTLKGHYNLSDNRKVLGVSPGDYRQHGAFAEYVAVPAHILYKIPENVSFTEAAMVEPVAVSLHGLELTPICAGDSAVVVGAGMIGFFVIQLLRIKGCSTIIAIDIDDEKLKMAKIAGADVLLNSKSVKIKERVLNLTNQRGADICVDAVGISDSVNSALETVRKGGTVTLIGNLAPRVELPLQSVVTREIRLQGSCSIRGEFEQVLNLLSKKLIDTSPLLSAEAPLSKGADWFKRLYNKEKGLNKVVLVP